jgi:hypothetical protein
MSVATKITSASAGLSDTAKNVIVIGGVALVGFAVYKVFDGVNSVAESLNLKDTKEEKKAKKELDKFELSNDFKLAFTPDLWMGKIGDYLTISNRQAIDKAFGGLLNDEEEKIYGVYRQTPSKASMMKIALAYWATYKKDLYTELKSRLDSVEMQTIISIVKSKKIGTKKSK